jgi:3-oxoacyl-[acyl-carrier protein] reductase
MNKVVFITGGSSGIGKELALTFAKNNYDVAINYSHNKVSALEVVSECEKFGVKAKAYQCDVSDYTAVGVMVKEIKIDFKKIDVLVNNAGVVKDNLLIRLKQQDIDSVIDINLKGTIYVSQAIAKMMMRQKSGVIINMASVIGQVGNITQSTYAASKAGIIGFTKALAKELSMFGIRVNAIAPGFINTRMTEELSVDVKENILKNIPLKTFGTTKDVANTTLFIASENAQYITGQVINVDGGMVM